MGKNRKNGGIGKNDYETILYGLHIELVKLQKHFIAQGKKILVILEGRDAAGKDGAIKRITEHLSPRETRVVALGKPSDREKTTWYFQRFAPHLPAAQEFVLFNRSWYNRAGVERVMGFCTEEEYEEFASTVHEFEHMLVRSGIRLFKYYLDISKSEQKKRLEARRTDPLKQWKISPVDEQATKYWNDYSRARNEMFARTHLEFAPWTVVRADNKRLARLNLIKDILGRLDYERKDENLVVSDPEIVFEYTDQHLKDGLIAR
ncbi:MAG: polyphosphate kinase 2 [Blastocatellales bacterium]|nr:polyphosphate kinase 2 [Blastocatellales bacterium]